MPHERLALLLILLLSALLAVPAKATVLLVAAPPANPMLPQALAADEADQDEPLEDEAAEEKAEDEAREAEECEVGEEQCAPEAGDEEGCLLTAVQATVSASPHADRIRVAIRYTALRPAAVAVRYQVRVDSGGVRLGSVQAHFVRKGVFHDTIVLNDRELGKVISAREVAIGLHALNTPDYCRHVFQQHLTPRRSGNRQLFS
jgi:hypothetical protein